MKKKKEEILIKCADNVLLHNNENLMKVIYHPLLREKKDFKVRINLQLETEMNFAKKDNWICVEMVQQVIASDFKAFWETCLHLSRYTVFRLWRVADSRINETP